LVRSVTHGIAGVVQMDLRSTSNHEKQSKPPTTSRPAILSPVSVRREASGKLADGFSMVRRL
jgi:hypothetical protein